MLEAITLKKYELFKEKNVETLILLENQGHCNHNYLLLSGKKRYLIREFKLKNDRKSEFKIQTLIAKKNIGATPLLLDEPKGIMVCEFIEGVHKTKLNQQRLKKLALLLKRLHHIKIRQKPNYLKKKFKFKDKKAIEAFKKLTLYKKEPVLCHNDLHPKNILFAQKNVQLIDWEYAGVNDKYFDLVSVIIEFKFNKKEEAYFLNNYFRKEALINHKKLALYKIIHKEFWKLWFKKLNRGEL